MREKDHTAIATFCNGGEKFVTGRARRRFNRNFLFGRHCAHARRAKFKIEIVLLRELRNKTRVCVARAAAQLMVQMADNEIPVIARDQPM